MLAQHDSVDIHVGKARHSMDYYTTFYYITPAIGD